VLKRALMYSFAASAVTMAPIVLADAKGPTLSGNASAQEFAAGLSGARYVHPRRELQPLVAAGQAQGPLARRQRLCVPSLQDETIGGKGMNPSEPGAVLELCGNLFGHVEAIKRFLDAP